MERIRTRFLVVGSGVAGLHTAWRASEHGDVLLLTKKSLFDSATAYAQGGIAAALGAGDSPALHRQDTLAAGAALCDAAAVQVLVEEGPARVRELQTAGAQFDLAPSGKLKLGRAAAHSKNPVVATGDGCAIAHRACGTLADMEFVQFHPTALDTRENPLALVSEAVRN